MTEPKLVRDRIPEIIRSHGGEPVVRTADAGEYRHRLWAKLTEETGEFLAAEDASEALEELADVLEVVHALAAELGSTPEALEAHRAAKAAARGGFRDRIVWSGNR